MSKCRYDLSEDCNSSDCLACVLDKIRAEIERRGGNDEKAFCKSLNESYKLGLREAIDIIDKYKAESEEV